MHKVIDVELVKPVDIGRQSAVANHRKLIDGMKRIDEVTEGKKHISEIAEVGCKTFEKIQVLNVEGVEEMEGMKRIEEAIVFEVFETKATLMQGRVDKERIIEEKRVEERIYQKEREERLKDESERIKEEERLERELEEIRRAREIRRLRRNESKIRRRELQRRDDEEKVQEKLDMEDN